MEQEVKQVNNPAEEKEVLLRVIDADIHFKLKRKVIKACNHLNFEIYKGETFGLVGESGSGKTTISRAILAAISCSAS